MKKFRKRKGVPDKKKCPKAYKRHLRRLREIDRLLAKGRIRPSWQSVYPVKAVVSGGLPSLGKKK